MQNKIIIRPEAEQDMSDAFDWYEDKREGLDDDFLAQVKSALMLLPKIRRYARLYIKQPVNI